MNDDRDAMGPRSRTPNGMRSIDKLDFYGRKQGGGGAAKMRIPNAKQSVISSHQGNGSSSKMMYHESGTPLMENIQLEIRSHMEDAKHEITILQRQYEQRMLKKSVKLGLTGSNKG